MTGYLAGGMAAWENAGHTLERATDMHVRELESALQAPAADVVALGVRSLQDAQARLSETAPALGLAIHVRSDLSDFAHQAVTATALDSRFVPWL